MLSSSKFQSIIKISKKRQIKKILIQTRVNLQRAIFSSIFFIVGPSDWFTRPTTYESLILVDLCVDIFFFCDIVVNFRTTYIGKTDAVVTDPKKIALRYLRTYFIVDLVAAIPWDLIAERTLEVIIFKEPERGY